MPSWHPDQYLRFADLRTRPARDLLERVEQARPALVVDVGCGAGSSTALLVERWPQARVIGVDTSARMLERARTLVPTAELVRADLTEWMPPAPVQVVFANAVLHWAVDHPGVLSHLLSWLGPGGTLAVQMPANFDQPSHRLLRELAGSPPWSGLVGDLPGETAVVAPDAYWEMLAPRGPVDVWTTEYLQVLEGENPITEWMRGTAMRPVLDRLSQRQGAAFLGEYSDLVGRAYPRRGDGTTLFPFRRLFFVLTLGPPGP